MKFKAQTGRFQTKALGFLGPGASGLHPYLKSVSMVDKD